MTARPSALAASRRGLRRGALAALVAIPALLAFGAGTSLAGGVAVIVPVADDGSATTAGEPRTVQFRVMQHGVSPVTEGVVNVVLVDTGTGESSSVAATPVPDAQPGTYQARLVFPRPGWWTWHVELAGLVVQSGPTIVGVLGDDEFSLGYEPGSGPTRTAADQAAAAPRQGEIDALTAQRNAAVGVRDSLRSDLDDAQARLAGSVPGVMAVGAAVLFAVIVAIASFGIGTRIGRDRRMTSELSAAEAVGHPR